MSHETDAGWQRTTNLLNRTTTNQIERCRTIPSHPLQTNLQVWRR